jgi:hypothetical protein
MRQSQWRDKLLQMNKLVSEYLSGRGNAVSVRGLFDVAWAEGPNVRRLHDEVRRKDYELRDEISDALNSDVGMPEQRHCAARACLPFLGGIVPPDFRESCWQGNLSAWHPQVWLFRLPLIGLGRDDLFRPNGSVLFRNYLAIRWYLGDAALDLSDPPKALKNAACSAGAVSTVMIGDTERQGAADWDWRNLTLDRPIQWKEFWPEDTIKDLESASATSSSVADRCSSMAAEARRLENTLLNVDSAAAMLLITWDGWYLFEQAADRGTP